MVIFGVKAKFSLAEEKYAYYENDLLKAKSHLIYSDLNKKQDTNK
jgi:hypothetical protein